MEYYRGHYRERYGHVDVNVAAAPACSAAAAWVLDFFENQIRKGKVFRPGETIQVGWVTAMLSATQAGDLELMEPDFASVPVNWVAGLNSTLRQMIIQKEVCDEVGADLAYPSMLQSGVV